MIDGQAWIPRYLYDLIPMFDVVGKPDAQTPVPANGVSDFQSVDPTQCPRICVVRIGTSSLMLSSGPHPVRPGLMYPCDLRGGLMIYLRGPSPESQRNVSIQLELYSASDRPENRSDQRKSDQSSINERSETPPAKLPAICRGSMAPTSRVCLIRLFGFSCVELTSFEAQWCNGRVLKRSQSRCTTPDTGPISSSFDSISTTDKKFMPAWNPRRCPAGHDHLIQANLDLAVAFKLKTIQPDHGFGWIPFTCSPTVVDGHGDQSPLGAGGTGKYLQQQQNTGAIHHLAFRQVPAAGLLKSLIASKHPLSATSPHSAEYWDL
ncbi:hypothetical protein PGT21_017984 [Puccinia graminis f. sp. tritici]|uniref:Uncharacterized protein n=1 Tax=Puccinia graminis f. sp. tritici TaxID=56615 RepID=A0A5B0NFZ0_PUCGR|nr:hypothetical protein PGT21_017984 [Puccinia graminis f. sp. tritici]